jgi:AcrR family transcriptional regulator
MHENQTTKDRLIEAAGLIFAEKGYRQATIAEISEAAEANIAAVNYHFGDKANLYAEVWRHLSRKAGEEFPVPEAHHDVGAEEWLRLFLRSRLGRIFADGPAGLFAKLIFREMHEFTPQHDVLAQTYLKPNRERVRAAISDFMGRGVDAAALDIATANFMGVHISLNLGFQKHRLHPEHAQRFAAMTDSEPLIRQMEAFAIGGLREVKQSLTP